MGRSFRRWLESLRMEEIGPGWSAWGISLWAGGLGGLADGGAMALVAIGYGLLSGKGLWFPVNLIGATVVRGLQAAPPEALATFHPAALVAGLALHLILSVLLGVLYTLLLPTLPGSPRLWAVLVGPLLWLGATWVVLPTFNPIMAREVDWPSFALAHGVYGLTMGSVVARALRAPSPR